MMHRYITAAIFSSLFLVSPANIRLFAQTGTAEKILADLTSFCSGVPYEEIFVHYDRDSYVAGEDIWFNVFVIDRQTGKPSGRSRLVYFELLNPDNHAVVQKRLLISDGYGPGNILLPDTLGSGTYTIRVYTNRMKNFMPVNCFMRNINIYNPFRNKSFIRKVIYEKRLSKDLNIEFFPEGGTLLSGIPSRMAVRVTDRYQRCIPYSGIVRDNRGDSVTYFKTDGCGISSFEFTPLAGLKYFLSSGDSVFFLPDASDQGYALKVNNLRNDLVSISVTAAGNIAVGADKSLFLIIHTRGIKDYLEYLSNSGRDITLTLPKSRLSPGINHITLFNSGGTPLCERLIYTPERNLSDLNITGSGNYGRREKVTLELDLTQAGIKSYNGANLGLSVTPQSAAVYSQDIREYLVFGTEFGYLPWEGTEKMISDPDQNVIDDFLITARSRWISWDRILSGFPAPSEFLSEEEGHILSGWLKKRNSPDIEPGNLLYLSVPGKTATFQYARTGNSGHFSFLLPAEYSPKILIIQPAVPDVNFIIQIESSFSLILPGSVNYADSINKELPRLASNLGASYQVSKIYGNAHRIESLKEDELLPAPLRFYGKPETELIVDDFIRLPVMQEIFFELTPGIRLRSKKSGYEMRISNPVDNNIYDEAPLVMIDGVVINDLTVLADLDPESVEKIDAVRTPYLTGELKHYGIVNVITRTGNFSNIVLPDYAARLQYRVAEPLPVFYAPEYSDPVKKQSRIPDFRNTLFWSPSLMPDNNGRIRIEFWASDIIGEYIVNIQGVTKNGELISAHKIIRTD